MLPEALAVAPLGISGSPEVLSDLHRRNHRCLCSRIISSIALEREVYFVLLLRWLSRFLALRSPPLRRREVHHHVFAERRSQQSSS
jgi:hypothetical protein